MPFYPGADAVGLIIRAQMTIGMLSKDVAELVGVSARTVQRWSANQSHPTTRHILIIARATYPKDPALAAQLAAEGGQTLESLGLVPPPLPAPPPSPPVGPPPRAFPSTRLVVDSVVCAATEALQSGPSDVRGVLRSAFARARALGLSVEEVDDALAPAPVTAPAPAPASTTRKAAKG